MHGVWRPASIATFAASIAGACGEAGPTARSLTASCDIVPGVPTALAVANDQRTSAGVRFADTVDLQIDIRRAVLLPEGDAGPRLDIVAFGEAGGAASQPGPLVRATVGTTVLARVCNTLADTVWLVGLAHRGDTVVAAPGHTAESIFTLDAPGAREYRGITRQDTLFRPAGPTATLAGAIVVDGDARRGDRVLVITDWAPDPDGDAFALMINGRSWPHTERLQYAIGDTARWIVVNASPVEHPMHLHGFHFLVTARSDAVRDSIYTKEQRRLAVTELLLPGQSMAVEWVPERGGRWLLHCHIASHMAEGQRIAMLGLARPDTLDMHTEQHAERAMAGLVLGIEVTGDPRAGLPSGEVRQRERLLVQDRPGVYPGGVPGYGYVLHRGEEPDADSIVVPGPPIVITRGERSEINVVNRLAARPHRPRAPAGRSGSLNERSQRRDQPTNICIERHIGTRE